MGADALAGGVSVKCDKTCGAFLAEAGSLALDSGVSIQMACSPWLFCCM
jgi:hypothetical protein